MNSNNEFRVFFTNSYKKINESDFFNERSTSNKRQDLKWDFVKILKHQSAGLVVFFITLPFSQTIV